MATGLQSILNAANGITINRRKIVGIQFTRNEIPRTSLTPTYNPWRMDVELPNSFRYYDARSLLEQIDTLDRITPQVVSFGDNAKLSWIFAYQGSMSQTMINNITVQSFVGNLLTLTNLPVVSSTRVLFEPNDIIQIGNYPYPFTSTTQITRGTGSTVTVTTNRPNILTGVVAGSNIIVGNSASWNMFCPNMPVYKLTLGGAVVQNGIVYNNALIQWSDKFSLYEYVGFA
jgi:hypothetical protein